MKKLNLIMIVLLALFLITAYIFMGDSSDATVKKIRLNEKSITLKIGEKKKLKAKTDLKVKWKSSRKKIASVNNRGVVKGKASGTAKITAYAKKDKNIKAVCKVEVERIRPPMTDFMYIIFDHAEVIDDTFSYVYGKPYVSRGENYLLNNGIEILRLKTQNSRIEELNPVSGDKLGYVYSYSFYNVTEIREGNMLTYDFEGDILYSLATIDRQTMQ